MPADINYPTYYRRWHPLPLHYYYSYTLLQKGVWTKSLYCFNFIRLVEMTSPRWLFLTFLNASPPFILFNRRWPLQPNKAFVDSPVERPTYVGLWYRYSSSYKVVYAACYAMSSPSDFTPRTLLNLSEMPSWMLLLLMSSLWVQKWIFVW